MTDIDDLAAAMRSTHDKIENKCAHTVLAVELVALQIKVDQLTRRVNQLERAEHDRTQTQDANYGKDQKPR